MTTEVERIPWGEKSPGRDAKKRVREALEEGRVVAFPTETVYGLAARADRDEAVMRLRGMKGRDPGQPLTWHVGTKKALGRMGRVSPMVQRLVERYWPGPLTLVLPGVPDGLERAANDGWTGVRFPAHRATAELLEKVPFPVVATSANLHGKAPLADADAVAKAFGSELAFVLDGGTPKLGESSAVLRIGPGHFQVLREGLIDEAQLRDAAGLKIAFVCTGNTCRSPMAEGIARHELARRLEVRPPRLADFGFEISSMGVLGGSGSSASEHAVEVLRGWDIDISHHRSRPAVPQEVRALDRVYALTSNHLDSLRLLLPPGALKNCELLDPDGRDVPDPIGGPRSDYERAAESIRRSIEARLDEWA